MPACRRRTARPSARRCGGRRARSRRRSRSFCSRSSRSQVQLVLDGIGDLAWMTDARPLVVAVKRLAHDVVQVRAALAPRRDRWRTHISCERNSAPRGASSSRRGCRRSAASCGSSRPAPARSSLRPALVLRDVPQIALQGRSGSKPRPCRRRRRLQQDAAGARSVMPSSRAASVGVQRLLVMGCGRTGGAGSQCLGERCRVAHLRRVYPTGGPAITSPSAAPRPSAESKFALQLFGDHAHLPAA